jgi:hypothetical protein
MNLGHNKIHITSLNFFLTDKQTTQFRHSFTLSHEFGEEAIDDILRATKGGINTSKRAFANAASKVITYDGGGSTDSNNEAKIDGDGWDSPRLRWQMRAVIQQLNKIEEYILSGWTDTDGIIDKGTQGISLSPDMVMNVNSSQVITHSGDYGNGRIMRSNDQILLNTDSSKTDHSMRPSDNLSRINIAQVVAGAASSSRENSSLRGNHDLSTVLTGRNIELTNPSTSDMNSKIHTSRRSNNNMTKYLQTQVSKLSELQLNRELESFDESISLDDYSDRSVYHDCETSLAAMEDNVSSNIMIDVLSRASDIFTSGSFTVKQLGSIDTENSLQNPNVVSYSKPTYGAMTCLDIATADWRSANLKTMIASAARDSLPDILIKANIAHARMLFSNINLANVPELHPVPINAGREIEAGNLPVPMVAEYENVNVNAAWEYIKNEFLDTIEPLITQNGQVLMELDIDLRVKGNCIVSIRLDGDSEVSTYTAAMYADRLFTPIVTSQINNANMIANSVNSISNSITSGKMRILEHNGLNQRSGITEGLL